MPKRKLNETVQRKEEGMTKKEEIRHFWDTNYQYNVLNLQTLEVNDVYALYLKCNPGTQVNLQEFKSETPTLGVKYRKYRKVRCFQAIPFSVAATEHHRLVDLKRKSEAKKIESGGDRNNINKNNKYHMHLCNIQGLITNSKNKGEYINLVTTSGGLGKVIAMTETHLNKKKLHDDPEVLASFPKFSLHRCDRDTAYDLDDEYQLKSHGGCLILTSPEYVSSKKLSFSNGNCSILAVEIPELHLHQIVIYRPPPPNSSLRKFQEILQKLREFLLARECKDYNVVVSGDFNFPEHVVEWNISKEGVFPNQKVGSSDEKIAFGLLLDLCDEFGLEQLVDKKTRGHAILDLVFTDTPSIFGSCETSSLAPHSDHNLVTFPLNIDTEHKTCKKEGKERKKLPEIAKFDFEKGERDRISEALSSIDWEEALGGHDQLAQRNDNFVSALVKALEDAQVPRISDISREKHELERKQQRRKNLVEKLKSRSMRDRDRLDKEKEVDALNVDIQDLITARQRRSEKNAIDNIRVDPKYFTRVREHTL